MIKSYCRKLLQDTLTTLSPRILVIIDLKPLTGNGLYVYVKCRAKLAIMDHIFTFLNDFKSSYEFVYHSVYYNFGMLYIQIDN